MTLWFSHGLMNANMFDMMYIYIYIYIYILALSVWNLYAYDICLHGMFT